MGIWDDTDTEGFDMRKVRKWFGKVVRGMGLRCVDYEILIVNS